MCIVAQYNLINVDCVTNVAAIEIVGAVASNGGSQVQQQQQTVPSSSSSIIKHHTSSAAMLPPAPAPIQQASNALTKLPKINIFMGQNETRRLLGKLLCMHL